MSNLSMQAVFDYFSTFSRQQLDAVVNEIITSFESEPSNQAFGDVNPQILYRWETTLAQINQDDRIKRHEFARKDLRRRQLRQRQAKRRELNLKKEKERERAEQQKPEPPSLYERMAAFISSIVEEEKPQLPKDMYSIKNVQREREQRSKPLKKGYYIRSKKPVDPNS